MIDYIVEWNGAKNASFGPLESPKSSSFRGLALPPATPIRALLLDPTHFRLGRYAPSQRSQPYRVALQLQILFVLALLIN